MEIIGYAGALLMGISLGLIGGGGSILTVPILVYLFAIDSVLATAYSLFIVGFTSLIGSVSHVKLGNINWQIAFVFGVPSVLSVFLTRMYVLPAIPKVIFDTGNFALSKQMMLLILFALIMLLASYSMIRSEKTKTESGHSLKSGFNYWLIFAEGMFVGGITGLVGAGGGFLIIPALVVLANLPMKQAIGTSLVIIAVKSLIGFVADMTGNEAIDWIFLSEFSAVAVAGIIAGSFLSKNMSNEKLKPGFGWFVLVMGVYILFREIIFK
jgi:hypothetical protein